MSCIALVSCFFLTSDAKAAPLAFPSCDIAEAQTCPEVPAESIPDPDTGSRTVAEPTPEPNTGSLTAAELELFAEKYITPIYKIIGATAAFLMLYAAYTFVLKPWVRRFGR